MKLECKKYMSDLIFDIVIIEVYWKKTSILYWYLSIEIISIYISFLYSENSLYIRSSRDKLFRISYIFFTITSSNGVRNHPNYDPYVEDRKYIQIISNIRVPKRLSMSWKKKKKWKVSTGPIDYSDNSESSFWLSKLNQSELFITFVFLIIWDLELLFKSMKIDITIHFNLLFSEICH